MDHRSVGSARFLQPATPLPPISPPLLYIPPPPHPHHSHKLSRQHLSGLCLCLCLSHSLTHSGKIPFPIVFPDLRFFLIPRINGNNFLILFIPEAMLMKERFAKLLLGEDMSGGAKGVSSALAISNAITNLSGKLEMMQGYQKKKLSAYGIGSSYIFPFAFKK